MISLKNTLKAISSKFSALNTLLNDVPHYTLLWTNPNPTSSFSAQTISLDLSKYDAVEVVFNQHKQNLTLVTQKIRIRGVANTCGNTNFGYFVSRNLTFKDGGVTFTNGLYYGKYNTYSSLATDNDFLIPYKIYGIKFGGV